MSWYKYLKASMKLKRKYLFSSVCMHESLRKVFAPQYQNALYKLVTRMTSYKRQVNTLFCLQHIVAYGCNIADPAINIRSRTCICLYDAEKIAHTMIHVTASIHYSFIMFSVIGIPSASRPRYRRKRSHVLCQRRTMEKTSIDR